MSTQELTDLRKKIDETKCQAKRAWDWAHRSDGNTWTEITKSAIASAERLDAEVSRLEEELRQKKKEINESAKQPEIEVMNFLKKWNNEEFPSSWRMGQAFVNHFGLAHPQCDVPDGPCLFHMRDMGKITRAIWEHFTKV